MLKTTQRFLSYLIVFVTVEIFFFSAFYSCLWESTSICQYISNQIQQTTHVTNAPMMLGEIDPNRKYAVFSTTSTKNVESLGFMFMLPLTALAWKRIGFYSIVIIVGSENVWNSDPLLYTVLTSVRKLDAVVIFLGVHPVNSVMVSQVRNICSFYRATHRLYFQYVLS